MKGHPVLSAFILILLALFVAGYIYYRPAALNYKLTLIIEKSDGSLASGSSVIKVRYQPQPQLFGAMSVGVSAAYGEAVAVDLGNGRVLFALLKEGGYRSNARRIALHAFHIDLSDYREKLAAMRDLNKQVGRKVELQPENLPMLVTFGDLNDPMSVKQVDPNDLAATFGEGVKLHSAVIEITDEDVTRKIDKWLPWLSEYRNKLFDGRTVHTIEASNRLANDLGEGSFTTLTGE